MSAPCIIEVALNGVVKKDVNPMVPRSPAEIGTLTMSVSSCFSLRLPQRFWPR